MTNEELVKLIHQGKDVNENMELLYSQNKRFIRKIAMKFSNNQEDINDLMQEAYFGLHEAVQRYDEAAGIMFITYASFWIKQSMARYFSRCKNAISLPGHLQRKIFQYQRFCKEYKKLHGEEPDDSIACKYLAIDLNKLNRFKKITRDIGTLESLDAQISDTDDLLLKDSIASNVNIEDEVIDSLYEKSLKKELWEIVKDNTSEIENDVISMRYKQNMTLQEIGDVKGLTRERIRQIETKGLRNLRKPKVRRLLEERFEINYARSYRGGLTFFLNNWSSIVEDIAIKNIEAGL